MAIKINEAAEVRERVQDGELIPISTEDKQAAFHLAERMNEIIAGQPILIGFLATEILCKSVVEYMVGPEWAKALEAVFKQIPIEN